MPVVLARIDDRLIHGQVTVGWSEQLRPDRILLATAREYDLTLITRDQALLDYAGEGFVRALRC